MIKIRRLSGRFFYMSQRFAIYQKLMHIGSGEVNKQFGRTLVTLIVSEEKLMKFKIGFVLGAAAIMAGAPITASAHDNGYYHQHQNKGGGDRLLGAAIGAVAGGVLGSNLAAGDVQQEGTALGAVIGGVAGYAIAGGGNSRRAGNYYNGGNYRGGNNYNGGNYRGGNYYGGNSRGGSYPSYSYSRPTYRTSYPSYGGNYRSYPSYRSGYSQPYYNGRPSISINLGSGGFLGSRSFNNGFRSRNRGFSNRRFNNRRFNRRSFRHH